MSVAALGFRKGGFQCALFRGVRICSVWRHVCSWNYAVDFVRRHDQCALFCIATGCFDRVIYEVHMKGSEPEWTNPKSSIGNCINCAKMQ